MKNMQRKSLLFVLIILAGSFYGFLYYSPKEVVEIDLENAPYYEVSRVLPYISINKKGLKAAETLVDINKHYKPSWVKEFVAVEVSTTVNGQLQKIVGKDDNLTEAQKELMNLADIGTKINVEVKYIPDNTLKNNDVKTFNFDFISEPEKNAQYAGGEKALKSYLEKNAITTIPENTFKGYDLTMITFTVNEQGSVVNAKLFNSSNHFDVDDRLMDAIREMPKWKPAQYANGQKTSQNFALFVGNIYNCMVHTLNTGKLGSE